MNFKFISIYFAICFVGALFFIPEQRPVKKSYLSHDSGKVEEYIPNDRDYFYDTIRTEECVYFLGTRNKFLGKKDIVVYTPR